MLEERVWVIPRYGFMRFRQSSEGCHVYLANHRHATIVDVPLLTEEKMRELMDGFEGDEGYKVMRACRSLVIERLMSVGVTRELKDEDIIELDLENYNYQLKYYPSLVDGVCREVYKQCKSYPTLAVFHIVKGAKIKFQPFMTKSGEPISFLKLLWMN